MFETLKNMKGKERWKEREVERKGKLKEKKRWKKRKDERDGTKNEKEKWKGKLKERNERKSERKGERRKRRVYCIGRLDKRRRDIYLRVRWNSCSLV
jgi:hypothetical protein